MFSKFLRTSIISAAAVVAMAAVEKNKDALGGNVEKMRYISLVLFGECLMEASRWTAEGCVMNAVAEAHADFRETLERYNNERNVNRFNFKKKVSRAACDLLAEIATRQYRKGGKAGPPRVVSPLSVSQFKLLVDHYDGEIMNEAQRRLPPLQQNDLDAIKANIRPVVREYLQRGFLDDRGANEKDNVDTHAKRVNRKMDKKFSSR